MNVRWVSGLVGLVLLAACSSPAPGLPAAPSVPAVPLGTGSAVPLGWDQRGTVDGASISVATPNPSPQGSNYRVLDILLGNPTQQVLTNIGVGGYYGQDRVRVPDAGEIAPILPGQSRTIRRTVMWPVAAPAGEQLVVEIYVNYGQAAGTQRAYFAGTV